MDGSKPREWSDRVERGPARRCPTTHRLLSPDTAMAARTVLSKQLRQVADAWAPDPMFAPQFKTFLTSLSEHPNLTREAVDSARALQDNRILQKVPS